MSRRVKLKNRLLVPVEWLGIGLGLAVVVWLPRRVLFALCDCISAVGYFFDHRGKRRSLLNLRVLRGRMTCADEIIRYDVDRAVYDPTRTEELIIRRSYRNMARAVGYAFWTFRKAKERCAETGVASERTRRVFVKWRQMVAISGHIGCWEILSQIAFLHGHKMISVAKDIGTSGMTALLKRARQAIGQEIVSADGALKPLLSGIGQGKTLGLLVDQRVDPKRGGVWVRFLGCPMPVSSAPAFFAIKKRLPLCVAWCRPLKNGTYRLEIVDEVAVGDCDDITELTRRCSRDLERIVRRHPSCWVLNYNYFSFVPTAEDLASLEKREEAR